jgi:sulfite dehydrogenase (quinone) subunit SoeA
MRGWLERYFRPRERIDPSPIVADEVVPTTCYMCACRCGIRVHLKDGAIRYIDGNPNHPVNRGVICGKGAAGPMQQRSPAKLRSPLLRVGERGESRFKEIGWDEALDLAVSWLAPVRATDPRRLAFFTGRDQSQSLTSLWATSFGTPNWAAHGGFCSVNMAAAGQYTVGGSFWEFGEPDWEHARYFLLFGVAEDHDSNPIKLGLSELKARSVKIVAVNPVRTGYAALADEWLPIRPGTDGLLVLALVHELLRLGRVDLDYLAALTDAGWLVIDAPGEADDGLYARDEKARPLVVDALTGAVVPAESASRPQLGGGTVLPDGRRAVPVFAHLARRYRDPAHAPDAVAERCGIPAATIRRIAAEIGRIAFERPVFVEQPWTDTRGERHAGFRGRPVAMHAMRGISAHSNGFQTCRALHLLQLLIGSVDVPGGWRYKAPYPRPCPPGPRPFGRLDEIRPGKPLPGSPLGFPRGPEDLLVDVAGRAVRIDKAFSWDAPLAVHGMLQTVIANAWRGDPHPVEVLFLYMANMAWNSAMNPGEAMRMLADKDPATGEYRIPKFIYADAYRSETVAFADLVLPDTTYLERWDCVSLLDRPIGGAHGPGDAIRQPVVKPDRDVRPFQDVLIDLGARLKLPAFAYPDGEPRYSGGYPDYLVHHERKPGIGPLAGWRGERGDEHGRGAPNDRQLEAYVANGCFWRLELAPEESYLKPVNRAYLARARELGLLDTAAPITLHLYAETLQRFRLAALGHGPVQPPESHRERVRRHFDPLPFWYEPFEQAAFAGGDYPLHAVTQRPMPMYHSWHSQNAWLRQILARNFLYMNRRTAAELGLEDGDWVEIASPHGEAKAQLKLMEGCAAGTVWTWNGIGKRAGAWSLATDAPEAERGFLLNHVIGELLPEERGYTQANADPITGQAAWFDLKVRVEKAAPGRPQAEPRFPAIAGTGR